MRGVLGQVFTGAAGRILDSANPREIRTQQKAVSVAAKTREHTASMTREHKFLDGTCVSKNLDETVCLQSEIRREWIREIKAERLQGIAEGASSALRLASSSAASFFGRNECPGTHCSLIEQEERRQFLPDLPQSFKKKERRRRGQGGEDRTRVRQEQKKSEMADLLVLPRPAISMQNGAGFSGKT